MLFPTQGAPYPFTNTLSSPPLPSQITVWEVLSPTRILVAATISSSGVPVSAVAVRQGSIIAARLDGTISIYDMVSG